LQHLGGTRTPKLQPPRYSRLNSGPVGQEHDKEHLSQRSLDRVRKANKPIRERSCPKFLSFSVLRPPSFAAQEEGGEGKSRGAVPGLLRVVVILSLNSAGTEVTGRALNRYNAWAAIRKRAKAAGFLTPVGCHTWRATGITIYLENEGRLEHAQQMAGHESPRTTKLYDRTKDEITLSEVERIRL
jgi:hypothetical protein